MPENNYDIIIAGAGLAGLTLLRYLIEDASCGKQIAVIDSSIKDHNDKTYSFWAKQNDFVKNITHQKWDHYELMFEENKIIKLPFFPYYYYSVKSKDYYNYVKELAKGLDNIQFVKDEITEINYSTNSLNCNSGITYNAPLIFNSVFKVEDLKIEKPYTFLKQHFKGYIIETPTDSFEKNTITLMDFRTVQNKEVHFFYVLPESKKRALVEYTVFSEDILDHSVYDEKLKNYIEKRFHVSNYNIKETEFGVIPMTDQKFHFRNTNSQVYNIGTIAGFVKGSTGYSFYRCNEKIKDLVQVLAENDYSIPSEYDIKSKFRFRLYDSILLSAMAQKSIDTKKLFQKLYLDHKENLIFKFLNEETNILQEIKIMLKSPPKLVFNFFSRIIRFWKW